MLEESKKRTVEKTTKKDKKKRGGVIATIIECIKDKPMTRESVLKVLVKKFPERKESSMNTTVNAAIPSYLTRERGLAITKDDKNCYFAK